jgi:hypothetical protein
VWRREWDSNPRYGFPYTRFPSVRLKPLGHPSATHDPEMNPFPDAIRDGTLTFGKHHAQMTKAKAKGRSGTKPFRFGEKRQAL